MNKLKILFFVFTVFSSMVFAADKATRRDDSSSEEVSIFESGWQNHLDALSQDKYWSLKTGSLILKEQWIDSAVKAAMNQDKELEVLKGELFSKLTEAINSKFIDKVPSGKQQLIVDTIVDVFEKKLQERKEKQEDGKNKFLLLLKDIKSGMLSDLDPEWKKNILDQIKILIQLSVKDIDIASKIEEAIRNYNQQLSWYQSGYTISNAEKESILFYIKEMETIRDFQLQQLSTSSLQSLSDTPKDQQEEYLKLQNNFKGWLADSMKQEGWAGDDKWQDIAINYVKDLIDIYKNPQIVVDKIEAAFDQKEQIIRRDQGLMDVFSSNVDQKIDQINQIKKNITKNIIDYLNDYETQSNERRHEKVKREEVEARKKDIFFDAKKQAKQKGEVVDWLKVLSQMKEKRGETMMLHNKPKKDEVAKEQTWDEIVAERQEQRRLRLNPSPQELNRIKKEREEWQKSQQRWAQEEKAQREELKKTHPSPPSVVQPVSIIESTEDKYKRERAEKKQKKIAKLFEYNQAARLRSQQSAGSLIE